MCIGYGHAGGSLAIRRARAGRGAGRRVGAAHVHADADGAGLAAKVVAVVENGEGLGGRVAERGVGGGAEGGLAEIEARVAWAAAPRALERVGDQQGVAGRARGWDAGSCTRDAG